MGAETDSEVQNHPDVLKATKEATVRINSASVAISQGMYMEALKNGIDMAEIRRRENDPTGPRCVAGKCMHVKNI